MGAAWEEQHSGRRHPPDVLGARLESRGAPFGTVGVRGKVSQRSEDFPPTFVFVGIHEYAPEVLDDALRRLAAAHPGPSQLVLAIEMAGRSGDVRWVTELPQAMFVNPTARIQG
jgi:hypothetical protein